MTLTLPRWPAGPDATTPGDRCWLESKSARDDVTTLESGLMYRVYEPGPVLETSRWTPCASVTTSARRRRDDGV